MKTWTEPAYAKLNLSLDVLGKRADGFHDLRMVMQSVSLQDNVTLTLGETDHLRLSTNVGFLPADGRNIAVIAARALPATPAPTWSSSPSPSTSTSRSVPGPPAAAATAPLCCGD